MKKEVRQSNSRKETFEIAKDVLNNLGDQRIILLKGELGSGKTTFVQGLARALGIKERVASPSFLLMKIHPISPNCGYRAPQFLHLYHLDLYRLKKIKDIEALGLEEILEDKNNLVVIEWPEKIAKQLSKNRIEIDFKNLDKNTRKIEIKKLTAR